MGIKNLKFKIIKKVNTFFIDTLFPKKCLLCEKEVSWLCEICQIKIEFIDFQICPICEKYNTPLGAPCQKCKKQTALTGLIAASKYRKEDTAILIHNFKYNFIADLGQDLGKILLKSTTIHKLPLPQIIISVPLHPRRLRWRGFNQAEILAKYLSKNITPGLPLPISKDNLIRKKYTPAQMKIKNYHERKENLKDAFTIKNPEEIRNKIIWLIDDVATTGSTLFECAKVLKENGAKKIYALVLARQEFRK